MRILYLCGVAPLFRHYDPHACVQVLTSLMTCSAAFGKPSWSTTDIVRTQLAGEGLRVSLSVS